MEKKVEEEPADENENDFKKNADYNKENEEENKEYDKIMLIFFIGFLFCVFYIVFGQVTGLYPFQLEGEWYAGSFIGTGRIFLANPLLLYVIYWIALACLLLGFYRSKWLNWELITLIGIIGGLLFFIFFIRIYY